MVQGVGGKEWLKRRFPDDFAFQLSVHEALNLRSQIAASSLNVNVGWKPGKAALEEKHGGRRYRPWAFTEHGAIMAASVLNTPQAVRMSLFVVRVFVRLRETLAVHRELARKLGELERKVGTHDLEFQAVFKAIRALMGQPEKPKRRIGFTAEEKRAIYRV